MEKFFNIEIMNFPDGHDSWIIIQLFNGCGCNRLKYLP